MQVLEQAGASMVNGIQTMQLCQNKMASALTLDVTGFLLPRRVRPTRILSGSR